MVRARSFQITCFVWLLYMIVQLVFNALNVGPSISLYTEFDFGLSLHITRGMLCYTLTMNTDLY